jgi:hypothetical protein
MADTCTVCGRPAKTGNDHGFCTTKPDRVVKVAQAAAPA